MPLTHQSSLHTRGIGAESSGSFGSHNLIEALEFIIDRYSDFPSNADPSHGLAPKAELFDGNTHARRMEGNDQRIATASLTQQTALGEPEIGYLARIGVKGHPQLFDILVDTGTSKLLLPGLNCGQKEGCEGDGPRYQNSGIDQHEASVVRFVNGFPRYDGDFYFDDVSIGSLTATRMGVFSISKVVARPSRRQNPGILGLGLRDPRAKPSFFETLIAQHQVDSPVFTVYLGRAASRTLDKSSIVFGDTNHDLYHGEVTWTNVVSNAHWQTELSDMVVKGRSLGDVARSGRAIFDTGSPYIILPGDTAVRVWARVTRGFPVVRESKHNNPDPDIFFAYPCDVDPEVAFVFAGKAFSINPLDLSIGELRPDGILLTDSGVSGQKFVDYLGSSKASSIKTMIPNMRYCLSSIVGSSLGRSTRRLFLLGTPFMRNWVVIHDMNPTQPRLGFAAAAGNNNGEAGDQQPPVAAAPPPETIQTSESDPIALDTISTS